MRFFEFLMQRMNIRYYFFNEKILILRDISDTYSKKMNMFEFNFYRDTTWLIVMLFGITAWYLWLLKLPLEYSKKEWEIESIYKMLKKFYDPL